MKLTLSETQLQETVRRLAHFAPTAAPQSLLTPGDLVVETALLYTAPGKPFKVASFQETLVHEFGLHFEEDEIVSSLGRLGATGKVFRPPDENTWSVSKAFLNDGLAKLEERQAAEEDVYKDWLTHIDTVFSGCPLEAKNQLCEDLKRFVAKIFLRHGAECVVLIQGTSTELDEFLGNLGETIVGILPRRLPQMNSLMLQEFPAFFSKAPAKRKKYLAELLDSAFALYMVSVDGPQSDLIQKTIAGMTLYLDTNFIYRLFGLNGRALRTSARRLVSLSREFGTRLAASRKTIEELHASLAKAERALRTSARIPRELAAVGAEHAQREDFVTAYWHEYGATNIAIDDFIELYRHPEELLRSEGVEILDDLVDQKSIGPTLRVEVDILNGATGGKKPKDVAEHDAFHRILIRALRGGQGTTYIDTKYWFLTADSSLSRYDRIARRRQGLLEEAPFCIQPNQWLQLIRPLRPRTPDYDETFVDLLTSPYLRPYQALPADLAFKILARISLYKEHSPELAARALTNTYLTHQLRKAQTEEEENELIDNAASQAAEEFRAERDQMKNLLEAKALEIQQTVMETSAIMENLEEVEIEKEDLVQRVQALNSEVATLESLLGDERRWRGRASAGAKWLGAALFWAVGGIICWSILGMTTPSITTRRILATLVGVVTTLIGVGIPLGFYRSWKVICVIGVILGIVSAILNLMR